MLKFLLLPIFGLIGTVFVDLPLKLSFFFWRLWTGLTNTTAQTEISGCMGCFVGLPIFVVYIALTAVTAPFFLLLMVMGSLELKLKLTGDTPLEVAQRSFFWPHILIFWLMPTFYGVEVSGAVIYLLRDRRTGETAFVMPGPSKVADQVGDENT